MPKTLLERYNDLIDGGESMQGESFIAFFGVEADSDEFNELATAIMIKENFHGSTIILTAMMVGARLATGVPRA